MYRKKNFPFGPLGAPKNQKRLKIDNFGREEIPLWEDGSQESAAKFEEPVFRSSENV